MVLYVTAPVGGIVGYATVGKKETYETPFWPREIAEDSVLWPFRIGFQEMQSLERKDWESLRVKITPGELMINFRDYFQQIHEQIAQDWIESIKATLRSL